MNRLDQLHQMLEADPNDSFVLFAIAMEHKKNKKVEKAIECFLNLKQKDEKYVGMYYHLAKCYEELEDVESAMKTYSAGIKIATDVNDQHAKSELMNEKMNLEIEM